MNSSGARASVLALALMAGAAAAAAADVHADLKVLFDHGAKSTSSAIAAAREQYTQLAGSGGDPRIDYAYGVVLVNQRRYRDALPLLARYLETGKPQLTAYCVKMWAEIPIQEYTDVLEQAAALSRRFPSGSKPEATEEYRDAARFLGTIFGYLDLVRPEAIDAQVRADRQMEIIDRLGKTYAPDVQQGHEAVERRLAELRDEHRSELEELKAKLAAHQKQGKSAADEKASLQSDEEKRDEADKELTKVQSQLAPLQTKMTQLQTQITQAQMRLQRGRNNPYQMQSLRSNINTLSNQAAKLGQQMAPLEKSLAELESKEEHQAGAAVKDKAKVRAAEKTASETEKRIRSLDAQLKSTAPSGKMLLLSSYLPFPYEQERQRVAGWFAQ